jgi:hypothetical protein
LFDFLNIFLFPLWVVEISRTIIIRGHTEVEGICNFCNFLTLHCAVLNNISEK